MMHWLSYGGGVNSTALAILLQQGKVPGVENWTPIFADTGDEQDATYAFLRDWMEPWFREIRRPLVTVRAKESVLGRWTRLQVIGSRVLRTCTEHSKIRPIERHIKAHGGGIQIVGIDAGEAHRARKNEKLYPLVDLDIDRDECAEIISEAGFPDPGKSGCWHCPFMRVRDVVALARERPERFDLIDKLEAASRIAHPPTLEVVKEILIPPEQVKPNDRGFYVRDRTIPEDPLVDDHYCDSPPGWFVKQITRPKVRAQWHQKPAPYWRGRAALEDSQLDLEVGPEPELPCGCYDG